MSECKYIIVKAKDGKYFPDCGVSGAASYAAAKKDAEFAEAQGYKAKILRLDSLEEVKVTEDYSERLKGKHASVHSSWNGSHYCITIESAIVCDGFISLEGLDSWNKEYSIHVPEGIFVTLLIDGKASTEQEIDHCTVTTEYHIY